MMNTTFSGDVDSLRNLDPSNSEYLNLGLKILDPKNLDSGLDL